MNIYLIKFFLGFKDDNINTCADNTGSYSCAEDMSSIINELQRIAKTSFRWYEDNHMKRKPGKSYVLLNSSIQRVVLLTM